MSYVLSRWLFLRLLALVYLVAFVSLWTQIDGLIGSDGILPLGDYLAQLHERLGDEAYRLRPTLTWFGHSDAVLHALCAGGVLLSLALMVGLAPIPLLLALWAIYLSLQISGQVFLGFQWDILLTESGLAAVLYAPARWFSVLPRGDPRPQRVGRWLLWALLFKLMVLSGLVKLISLDESWWELTALDYHYFTTCLPIWTGWYAHHLPPWIDKLSVLLMFVVEIVTPFFFFGPRRLRIAACFAQLALQFAIAATGNYGFFNLLTIALCVTLLDDRFLSRALPERFRPRDAERHGGWLRVASATLAAVAILLSSVSFVRELVRSEPPRGIDGFLGGVLDAGDRYVLGWGQPLLKWVDPFNSFNGYGLFRAMTTARPEIVIEASMDGRNWEEYGFRWKPGDVDRAPGLVAPHMPRLDWQMWFAALNPRRHQGWMEPLLIRLLEGAPAVEELFETVPFSPPRYVRLVYYDYEFTDPGDGDAWWRRERKGNLSGPLSLETFSRSPTEAKRLPRSRGRDRRRRRSRHPARRSASGPRRDRLVSWSPGRSAGRIPRPRGRSLRPSVRESSAAAPPRP